jgi:DNA integrity scanning protein DisA with diadenylate cyclase activity
MDLQTLTFMFDLILLFAEIAIAYLLLTHYRKMKEHITELDRIEEKIGYHVDELGQHTRRVKASADKLYSSVESKQEKRKKTFKG